MSVPDTSEVEVIQRAAGGDGEAFTALFHQHFQAVYNYALWLSNDLALAEDLTQEAFIRAHDNLHKFGPPWKFRAWLYRFVHNLMVDHTRRKRPTQTLAPDALLAGSDPDPERMLLSGEMAVRVRSALLGLPERYREVLVLREVDGLAYEDIAQIMQVSLSSMKSLLLRARSKFKETYGLRLLAEDPLPACEVLNELLDSFHDGESLSARERFVHEHLKECPTCRQRRRELVALSGLLGMLVPITPPSDLAPRILKQTLGSKQMGTPRSIGTRRAVAALAAVALAAVLALTIRPRLIEWLWPDESNTNRSLESEMDDTPPYSESDAPEALGGGQEPGACFDACDPDDPDSCLAVLSCLPRVIGGDEYICYNKAICSPDVTQDPGVMEESDNLPCVCGDGICEQERCGELQENCPADCGSDGQQPPPPPPPPQPTSPPPPPVCGDSVCNGDETCWSCSADCGPC